MTRKIMLEVTQPVVDGNTVVIAAGTLYEPGTDVPDGVTVREVIADVPDQPEATPAPPAAKAAAKAVTRP